LREVLRALTDGLKAQSGALLEGNLPANTNRDDSDLEMTKDGEDQTPDQVLPWEVIQAFDKYL